MTCQFVLPAAAQQIYQFLLFFIRILKFIYHDELETAAVPVQYIGILCQKLHRFCGNKAEACHFLGLGRRKEVLPVAGQQSLPPGCLFRTGLIQPQHKQIIRLIPQGLHIIPQASVLPDTMGKIRYGFILSILKGLVQPLLLFRQVLQLLPGLRPYPVRHMEQGIESSIHCQLLIFFLSQIFPIGLSQVPHGKDVRQSIDERKQLAFQLAGGINGQKSPDFIRPLLQLFLQESLRRLLVEGLKLIFFPDGEGRVHACFCRIFPDDLVAEAVDGGDGRRGRQLQLLLPEHSVFLRCTFI